MKQGRRGKERGWDGRVRRGSSRQIKFYDCTALSIVDDWFESLTILATESDVACTLSIDENEITNSAAQCLRRLHQHLMRISHMRIHFP
jgi:hypothetical protein